MIMIKYLIFKIESIKHGYDAYQGKDKVYEGITTGIIVSSINELKNALIGR